MSISMRNRLKELLERAEAWPEADQKELAEHAEEIESRHSGVYHATADELQAIDDAESS